MGNLEREVTHIGITMILVASKRPFIRQAQERLNIEEDRRVGLIESGCNTSESIQSLVVQAGLHPLSEPDGHNNGEVILSDHLLW